MPIFFLLSIDVPQHIFITVLLCSLKYILRISEFLYKNNFIKKKSISQ
jgi:hypothetical protein